MARKPIKPSRAARNQRKQEQRKLTKRLSQLQRDMEQALEKSTHALEQAKLMGQWSQQLATGAMSALNIPKE